MTLLSKVTKCVHSTMWIQSKNSKSHARTFKLHSKFQYQHKLGEQLENIQVRLPVHHPANREQTLTLDSFKWGVYSTQSTCQAHQNESGYFCKTTGLTTLCCSLLYHRPEKTKVQVNL